MDISLYLVRK